MTVPPGPSPYDADPQAIAWARERILYAIAKAEDAGNNRDLAPEVRERWRGTAYYMRHELLGEGKTMPGPFDERLPAWTERATSGSDQ